MSGKPEQAERIFGVVVIPSVDCSRQAPSISINTSLPLLAQDYGFVVCAKMPDLKNPGPEQLVIIGLLL